MPSHIELDKQLTFPASSDQSKVILGVNTSGQAVLVDNNGVVNPFTRPYKVFTALLTQIGISDSDVAQVGDTIVKGVTYEILNGTNYNVTQYGAPNNNVGTFFISNITTEIVPVEGEGANLRFNTGAPVATVLENTIGNVWFTYEDPGIYKLNSNSLFGNDALKVPKYENVIVDIDNDQIYYIRSNWQDANTIEVQSRVDGANTGNSLLNNTFIEIRVYN